ncbi:MAG: tRNA pseudouridine(38-40) synthase TruA [Holosporales bacterium]|jgi:tRNA pseudouridine38-40 synthase|nr:tRNA pseudouridine(38-40) synthase TruA [Holosporales bacterium]
MRVKLTIEYDGGRFYGWQKQKDRVSVQETIERAISKLFNETETIELYGAGRTDTGVHATGQVAHFDITSDKLIDQWTSRIRKLPIAINSYLIDSGAVIVSAEAVQSDFHARASAIMRHYVYLIFNRSAKSVIYETRTWHVSRSLDYSTMNEAAQLFVGANDLNSFRSAHCSALNPVRTISAIGVQRDGDFVRINVMAKSFLHNQVRIMVGTLAQIGLGKYGAEHIRKLLDAKDRTLAGPTAPPHGLYLVMVQY